jgi:predicted transcriptional regulator
MVWMIKVYYNADKSQTDRFKKDYAFQNRFKYIPVQRDYVKDFRLFRAWLTGNSRRVMILQCKENTLLSIYFIEKKCATFYYRIECNKLIKSLSMRYRTRTEIIARILEVASEGTVLKTKIMYGAFLSHQQLKEYLSLLLDRQLIQFSKQGQTYRTTDKGLHFLHIYTTLNDMIDKKSKSDNKNIT